MTLDLSSFERALAQLRKALAYAGSDLARSDDDIAYQFRASSIQAFEYTYELAVKMLTRFFEMTESNAAAVDAMSFQQLMRLGYERGLLHEELAIWLRYRKNRGTTSHTYDQQKAEAVFADIPPFLSEASSLLVELQRRAHVDG